MTAGPAPLVVLVRDAGLLWIPLVARAITDAGAVPALVTPTTTDDVRARLAALVDDGVLAAVAELDDFADARAMAATARELADSTGAELRALLAPSDGGIVTAAQAAELLGVARCPAAALVRSRNKHAARVALRAAGAPTPRFALIDDPAQAADVADEVGLPAIIKPVNGTGSHLVERVGSVGELAAAHRRIASRLLDTRGLRPMYAQHIGDIDVTSTFLVESLLRGEEYSIDVVVRDGAIEVLPIMHKFLIDERHFELGFANPPFGLDEAGAARITAVVAQAVTALGLDDTLASVEVIDDVELGPVVVEVNGGRPGGQILGVMYSLLAGVDTGAEMVSLALGTPSPRTAPRLPIPLASLTLFPGRGGTLRAVHGLDAVAELPDVIHVSCAVEPGDVLPDDVELFAVNLIVAGFTETAELEETYATAASLVTFEFEPDPVEPAGGDAAPIPVAAASAGVADHIGVGR